MEIEDGCEDLSRKIIYIKSIAWVLALAHKRWYSIYIFNQCCFLTFWNALKCNFRMMINASTATLYKYKCIEWRQWRRKTKRWQTSQAQIGSQLWLHEIQSLLDTCFYFSFSLLRQIPLPHPVTMIECTLLSDALVCMCQRQ